MAIELAENLELVRLRNFENIPRELFSDSADEMFNLDPKSIDRLYQWGNIICSDPYQLVFGFVNEKNEVCGIFWLVIDLIYNALNCRFISVLPEYRNNTVMRWATSYMQEIAEDLKLDRLLGCTAKDTTAWKKLGWEVMQTRLIIQNLTNDKY